MITAKYSRQKPQGGAAKAIVSCSLQSSDHRKVLTTEAARRRSKSNRQLFVTVVRSPESHSRQKPQGGAAKAIVSCSLQSSDHRKVLTTEAARMRSKSNRQLFVTVERSPQSTHDRSRKEAQQKQSSVVRYSRAITAKYSRQKPQGGAAKAIVSCWLQSSDHRKVLTTEAARMRSKSNRQLFVTVVRSPQSTHDREAARRRSKSNRQLFVTVERSPQSTHDRSRKEAQQKQSSVVRYSRAITAKYSRQKPQGCAAKAIVSCWLQSSDHRKVLTTEAARTRSKSNRQLFVTVERSPQSTHDRCRKEAQQKQSSVLRYSRAITAKYSRQKPQGCEAKAIVSCSLQSSDHRKVLTTEAARRRSKSNCQLFVTVVRSPQSTHDRSRKDAQQKQSSVAGYSRAITAKYSRQKPQGGAAKAIVSCSLQSSDHRKRLTREAIMIHTQQNHSRSLCKGEAIVTETNQSLVG